MQEKLTIPITSAHKKFIQRLARRQNKSISRFIDDLLASVKQQSSVTQQNDNWLDKTAGSYSTGKKDALKELFKGIHK